MDDQLDEDLRDHIKKVFENYDDPSADEGWLKLREKFPGEKAHRRAVAWIWWSAAALLLLLLGFGLWKYSANNQPGNLAIIKKPNTVQPENLAAAKSPQAKTGSNTPPVAQSKPETGSNRLAKNPPARQKQPSNVTGIYSPPIVKQLQANSNPANKKTFSEPAKNSPMDRAIQPQANQLAIKKTDSIKNAVSQPPANQIAAVQPNNRPAKPTDANAIKPKSMASMFADNTDKPKKADEGYGRVRFGVLAESFVNYAKGSGNQGNYGAGFSAEIKISKNLRLVTGVTLAQNSLNYAGGIPTNTAQSNVPNFSNLAGASASFPSSFTANAAVTIASVPAFKNYGASLVSIDIPVNLKYDFNPKKNDIYFMAGLSSGTFANETYTYQYNYPAILSPSLQQTQAEISKKSFNSFYFGKMLNVAFGYGYRVGRNNLILEPFLRYPLDGLGSQNIRFGAGGINLKFNFPTSGK